MPSRTSAAAAGIRKRNIASYHVVHIREQPQAHPTYLQGSTPWHVVFIFVIPVQADVIQMHFQNSSPFETHSPNMWTFVFAILLYCIALGYSIKSWLISSKRFKNICDKIGYISGFLASAAFISVLVPPSFEAMVFVIWMVISTMFVDVARNCILKVAQKLYQFVKDVVSYVYNIWEQIIGSNDNIGATTIPM